VDLDHVSQYCDVADLWRVFGNLVERTQVSAVMGVEQKNMLEANGLRVDHCHAIPLSEHVFDQNLALANKAMRLLGYPDENYEVLAVERRQKIIALDERRTLVVDYAHHPTEIRALLDWAGAHFREKSLRIVFQPHRYSRTLALFDEFVEVLKGTECTLIPEYAAFETKQKGATARELFAELAFQKGVTYCENALELSHNLLHETARPEVILMVGAGDIELWSEWIQSSAECPELPFEDVWIRFLKERTRCNSHFDHHVDLKRKVTLNAGGSCRLYAEPNSLEALSLLVRSSACLGVPFFILGKGSNLLVPEGCYGGLVISMSADYWQEYTIKNAHEMRARGGMSLKKLCRLALEHSWDGFQFLGWHSW
jgi:UDP-N-acetylmuramate--alanine ligase